MSPQQFLEMSQKAFESDRLKKRISSLEDRIVEMERQLEEKDQSRQKRERILILKYEEELSNKDLIIEQLKAQIKTHNQVDEMLRSSDDTKKTVERKKESSCVPLESSPGSIFDSEKRELDPPFISQNEEKTLFISNRIPTLEDDCHNPLLTEENDLSHDGFSKISAIP